jgi:hypothetical protein
VAHVLEIVGPANRCGMLSTKSVIEACGGTKTNDSFNEPNGESNARPPGLPDRLDKLVPPRVISPTEIQIVVHILEIVVHILEIVRPAKSCGVVQARGLSSRPAGVPKQTTCSNCESNARPPGLPDRHDKLVPPRQSYRE